VGRRARILGALCLTGATVFVGRAAAQAEPDSASPPPLFASHDVLALTIAADFEALRGDRSSSPDRPTVFSVFDEARGEAQSVGGEVRTRGLFRLDSANCSFPPLHIDVDGSDAVGTVLEGQDDLKLVSSCRPGRDAYTELVLTEFLVYRTYALLSTQSLRVRMVDVTFLDISGTHESETRPGFLIEEDDALAERLGAEEFDLEEGKNLPAATFDARSLLETAVFQYMIGNTDWSAVAGHNVEILDRGGGASVVPYDFDLSGVVDPPYATTNPDFDLGSVRERYYRGWCANEFVTGLVLDAFRTAQPSVVALWEEAPGLTEGTRRRVLRYLEQFFDDIETNDRAQTRFLRDCRLPA
jgi:hypothetical protein